MEICLLVSVDDALEVHSSTVYLLLEYRKHLWRVGGINDHSIFGLVVNNEIGVVVTTTLPYTKSASRCY